jgi:MFS family permease
MVRLHRLQLLRGDHRQAVLPDRQRPDVLLLAVATFGVGFFMRPVGGILLGIYADRVGRKAALSVTILLMAVGTTMIGLAPT